MNERVYIPNVLLFSGGRTSGYMFRRLLDSDTLRSDWYMQRIYGCTHKPEWIVVFCNTGKERNETLEFVHRCESDWNFPVIWLEYSRVPAIEIPTGCFPTEKRNQNLAKAVAKGESAHWFKKVDYQTASRNGEPFDMLLEWMSVLPNPVSRGCSMQLKIRTVMRYLFSLGIKQYAPIIGIRKDEEHRATQILANCDGFEHPRFPLIEMGISENHVTEFWKTNSFDLQLDSYEGNCDLCFLKSKWKRLKLIEENPGMVNWWKGWEQEKARGGNGNGKYFRLGEAYSDLEKIALGPKQADLFSIDKDIACTCVEKAFEPDED